ncbi:hypothetical protein ABT337_14755 [Saccharopolyspora hirsuta]|uniref:PE domain-containing protein n=1 Tax=Saccharopolyspora hirsuta TaxID=1837 RepID=A0A5M7C3E0_SACHI|nr:hypothetical protein [Saccharopolyspora hirsuta]KAA5836293.1 hypothetical protein F1721_08275 [Saccharopolyspora hirsuta]
MSEAEEVRATRTLARSAASIKELRRAVESNDLRLDPAAGEQIRTALEDQMSTVDGWLSRASGLTANAPLGQNPVGQAMAAKFASRAEGGENSFSDVLTKYRAVLEEARDAINAAMRTYEQADERAADDFRKIADDAFRNRA